MKRNIAFIIIILLLSSLFSFSANAVAINPVIELTSANTGNNNYTITVKLKGVTSPFMTAQVELNYDKSVLNYSGRTNKLTSNTIQDLFSDNGNGKLTLMWITNTSTAKEYNVIKPVNGEVTLCSLSFSTLKSANTNISINSQSFITIAEMVDSQILPAHSYISAVEIPISVIYTAPIPTTTPPPSTDGTSGGSSGGGGTGGGGAPVIPVITPVPTAENTFTDLEGYDWAKDSIYKLSKLGIIKGTSETTFSPANNITRADFAVLLSRTFNLKNEVTDNFNDVSAGEYFYEPIGILKSLSIAQGAEGNYRPFEPITRQDIIVLTHRALTLLGSIKDSPDFDLLNNFTDKAEIADYAIESVCVMIGRGIIKGNDGLLAPLNNATRAEAAVIFNRIYDILPK